MRSPKLSVLGARGLGVLRMREGSEEVEEKLPRFLDDWTGMLFDIVEVCLHSSPPHLDQTQEDWAGGLCGLPPPLPHLHAHPPHRLPQPGPQPGRREEGKGR